MTKKEYVFRFLDKVKGHREKESVIREYLSKNDDADYTEYLYQEFTKIVNALVNQKEEKKMGGIVQYLDSVKKHEKELQEAEQEDLKNLEELITRL